MRTIKLTEHEAEALTRIANGSGQYLMASEMRELQLVAQKIAAAKPHKPGWDPDDA